MGGSSTWRQRNRARGGLLQLLFHQLVPASLYAGPTAYAALSKIDNRLRQCPGAAAAAGVLAAAKDALCPLLQARFGSPLAEALTLKLLNILLARYHFGARSSSLLSRPIGLVVDPSNVCQLACPGCVHSTRARAQQTFDWPNGTLSEDRFSALLKLYGPHAIGVYFCDYGEPLLNLATPRLIRRAKSWLLGTALSTSLSVRRLDAEAYVECGLDFMVLSIDGATQPVYERFRRNGDLELVFSNIRKLVAAKRRLRKRTPLLAWNFLAFEHNAHEIALAERRARELGVNQFRVVQPWDVSWDDPQIRPAAVKTGVRRLDWLSLAYPPENWNPFPESVDGAAIRRAYENPWNGPRADEAPSGPGHTCHWLYKNLVMDATGRILPCCGAPRPDMNLVFTSFDGRGDRLLNIGASDIPPTVSQKEDALDRSGSDPFNSAKHLQARRWFSLPAALPSDQPVTEASANEAPAEAAPYCTRCEWDQTTVNIGAAEIRRYFRAADAAFFDRRSLRLLSGW